MTNRKELKIEAKQALETWSQTFMNILKYPDEIPQGQFDEFINLAIHSSGDIGDVLERIIQLMEQDDQEAEAPDMVELREDLQTALKEAIHFREQNTDYTRNELFADIGNLDELMNVDDLFNPTDIDDADLMDFSAENFIENHIEDDMDGFESHDFDGIEENLDEDSDENDPTDGIDLDDYLFDEDE